MEGRSGCGTNCSAASASERGGLGRKKGGALRWNGSACGLAAHQGHDPEVGERIQKSGLVVLGASVNCQSTSRTLLTERFWFYFFT